MKWKMEEGLEKGKMKEGLNEDKEINDERRTNWRWESKRWKEGLLEIRTQKIKAEGFKVEYCASCRETGI
jgi:hypothetical protein